MNDEKPDPIANALGVTPMNDAVRRMEIKASSDTAADDFTIARANIHNIIDNGTEALEKLSQIADASQHPRAYEVIGQLMKTLIDANKDLLNIQKTIREISDEHKQVNKQTNVQNNLFVGSTADLQKVLEGMRKNG